MAFWRQSNYRKGNLGDMDGSTSCPRGRDAKQVEKLKEQMNY